LKSAVERLTKLSHSVAENLYKKTGAAPGGEPGASSTPDSGKTDDVVDAEYTVKN
jgi:molecular chaperone DnaK